MYSNKDKREWKISALENFVYCIIKFTLKEDLSVYEVSIVKIIS